MANTKTNTTKSAKASKTVKVPAKKTAKAKAPAKQMVTSVNPMPQYKRQVDAIGQLVDVSPDKTTKVVRFSPEIGQRFQIQQLGAKAPIELYKFSLSSRKLRFVEEVTSIDATVRAIKRGKYRNVFGTYGQ